MRLLSILVIFIFPTVLYSQTWSLYKIEKTGKYRYEYKFSLDFDSSTYTLKRETGNQLSKISVSDSYGDTSTFAIITIKNLQSNVLEELGSDINGSIKLQFSPGQYEMEVSSFNYPKLRCSFVLDSNEYIEMKIVLGEFQELGGGYHIHSKKELTEIEILNIIDCYKRRKRNRSLHCETNPKYYVTMEI